MTFRRYAFIGQLAAACLLATNAWSADAVKVVFDLPETIECRDACPVDFATAHPALKVIEGRFRISARIVSGADSDILEFIYIVAAPDRRMKFQDYLPNTRLESVVQDDRIEITDTTEKTKATEADARVGYSALGVGLSRSKGAKNTESAHYHQVAARALLVASGTTDREHGLFFKLRPSKAASLEGAKEFTFLATVPKTWRADWCTISCAAQAKSKSFLARNSTVAVGAEQARVGIYLAGDTEAASRAGELRDAWEQYAAAVSKQSPDAYNRLLEAMYDGISTGHTVVLCDIFRRGPDKQSKTSAERKRLEEAEAAVSALQERLARLGSSP